MRYSTVHVDLPQLDRLAARLDALGQRLGLLADRLAAETVGLGLEAAPRRRIREAATWAEDQHRMLRSLSAEVRRLEAEGALPAGMTVTWRGHWAFADPTAAHAAATEAIALLAAGSQSDLRRAGVLMRAHQGDPVFAATLLHGVGAAGVAATLHRADRRWAQGLSVDRTLVDGFADALAVAMRMQVSPFGWRTLAEHSGRLPTGSRAIGLLFLAPAVFSTEALIDAVRHLVVPWNRAAISTPGAGSSVWGIAGPDGGIDVRATVLRRVADDPQAARTVVATTDLDDLLPADHGYGDGGHALAEVLVAGTAPVDEITGRLIEEPMVSGQRPATVLSAANLQKVVGWIGRPRSVPLGVELGIPRLLRPWIGSVRSAGLDGPVVRHVNLDEGAVRRVLGTGMRFDTGRRDLVHAAWWWAALESRRLASNEVGGAGFDAIGSVVGIVSIEDQNVLAGQAVSRDLKRDRQQSLWTHVQRILSKTLPGPARSAIGVIGGPLRGKFLPDIAHELAHWAEQRDQVVGHDALVLEYLVMATLWDGREANGYFAVPGGDLPGSLTEVRDGRSVLRPLVGLDEAGVADYLAWRSRLVDGRPAPVQLAAERFLAEGREVAPR